MKAESPKIRNYQSLDDLDAFLREQFGEDGEPEPVTRNTFGGILRHLGYSPDDFKLLAEIFATERGFAVEIRHEADGETAWFAPMKP